ncbi:adenosylcobinamide-phosphate synthase CbiB [Parasporobacterium paucivorans]|uniref:Cobalamin biosynthesis protein CobD n=1 Tax=Parasporobacterium paucivorans DSM 15970 TaxID=1122934 RepID=A0A1M6KJ33_9FIRM|nr:adenosylcobinamide-phosphate synthase CbiB [Parasporobacterium paucivorans]SHJ58860.1 adenosylcobinamide-phosphate synthase [Parasporobacterium paucivorans DSM 15970]
MFYSLISVGIGYILDLLVGDPRNLPHPIKLIGKLISRLEVFYRGKFQATQKGETAAGVFLMVSVILISTAIPLVILIALYHISPFAGIAAESLMCWSILATRDLKDESMLVFRHLKDNDVEGARKAVSMIVGRDTRFLDEKGIAKAAVETVAENTSDGVIAPMIFMIIGGAPLGFFYKAVNTMDSMVGYKNEKYLNLGRSAALLDDVLNYIPARFSAFMMILATYFSVGDSREAVRIYRRDRFNHDSPNSAHTEAVMAGALQLQLAGDAFYFGELKKKRTIGDPVREIESEDIPRANKLMYATSLITMVILTLIKGGILFLW